MLREEFKEWIDIDSAMFSLAKSFGIVGNKTFLETKWIYWSNNPIGNSLHEILESLVKAGVLEKRDEPDFQYRWNENFELETWKLKL